MPRLFIGLEVPDHVSQSLSFLRGGLPGARWIDAENYHVTLRFLGDIDDRTANEVELLLGGIRHGDVEIVLDGLDVFGGTRPRSLFVRVRPSPQLTELQADLERLARRAGLPAETRKFTPHITLARLRDVSSRTAADWLSMKGGFFGQSFKPESFVLFSSRASIGGGPYIAEASYPLW
ncbi:RNA 2',3'-cyclic phosphodiesterase [Agaricicola taiwanensis]|uniref:RNA 2',3'-cyclic phosphodiesterase n=1 Tax=Agaricicola taiwanensis TaxID=591372 RepID=A0A8J2YHJ6_9RHOB|nr:RNA 2',3'-cyclic phosphodiesterase [Agaricicola taiwanensis]GGE42967.1 RNA 2',3'-cyclic phosphodiesterase [Agaricicola taiwanensis]